MTSASAFRRRFPTEEKCVQYLEKTRWKGKPVCPRCGCKDAYRIATRKNYKCADCRRTFTVRHGTIFEDSKLPVLTWMEAIWIVTTTRPGVSSVELAEKLGITQKSAWFVLQRIQYAVSHGSFSKPLQGTVEVDEFEPHKRTGGKRLRVLAIVERQGGVRTAVVTNVGHPTITPLVQKHVAPGSTVMTDQWHGYQMIERAGYVHETVGHRAGEFVRGEVHTNTAEGLFGNFSRRLKGVHIRVSAKHLQKYCDMYAHRYNYRRKDLMERFDAWFPHVAARLTYKDLIA